MLLRRLPSIFPVSRVCHQSSLIRKQVGDSFIRKKHNLFMMGKRKRGHPPPAKMGSTRQHLHDVYSTIPNDGDLRNGHVLYIYCENGKSFTKTFRAISTHLPVTCTTKIHQVTAIGKKFETFKQSKRENEWKTFVDFCGTRFKTVPVAPPATASHQESEKPHSPSSEMVDPEKCVTPGPSCSSAIPVTPSPSQSQDNNTMSDDNGSATKRTCVRIGTHNGTFHCDETLACFMLQKLPQYKDAEIVRTRDPSVLETCDIVVDVGGVYDPTRHRYDHHQRTFKDTMNSLDTDLPWTIKLSSAGLVYFHFGKEVIWRTLDLSPDDPDVTSIYNKVYENFMQEVDAIDNGVDQTDEKPRYVVTTNLSARVGHLNPSWNDEVQDFESGFKKAVALTGEEFLDRINYYGKVWLPARSVVKTALQDRFTVDACGEIIAFPEGGCPWKEHLFELEKILDLELPIKYVLYPDSNGAWRIQCVPINRHSFENRLSLPEKWRGVRDEALSELTEIYGCIFVHASGFIGGNKSKEGALQMARKSLHMGQEMD